MQEKSAPEVRTEPLTSFNLLANNAIVRVEFAGLLNAEQYAALLHAANHPCATGDSLRNDLTEMGKRWGIPTKVWRVK